MRRTVYLSLVVLLALTSAVCLALIPLSFLWYTLVGYSGENLVLAVATKEGRLIIEGMVGKTNAPPGPFCDFAARPTAISGQDLIRGAVRFDWFWRGTSQPIVFSVAMPLWAPALAFGLWPGIVAVRALRQRRSRGFEVTAVEGVGVEA